MKVIPTLFCAAPMLLAAADSAFGAAPAPAPLVLGAVYNLTGSQAGLDIPSSRGAMLAAGEANEKGGVNGGSVSLVLVDGETDPTVITAGVEALFTEQPSVSALLGLSDTDMLLAAAPVAARHQRVFVTSGATSPKLPAEVPDYLFLACFGDNVQAAAGAEWAYRERGARTAIVLFNGAMSYAKLLHGYFETAFAGLGGKVLATRSYDAANLAGLADDLPAADLIYVAAGPADAITVSTFLRDAGVRTPILGGDGFDTEGPWGPEVVDVAFTTHAWLGPDNPRPAVAAFREAYAAAYPGDHADAFAALGYDTVNLILAAARQAGSSDPKAILAALPSLNFEGVTGKLSYPKGSRIPLKSVTIVGIAGGKRSFLDEILPSNVPPP